MLPKEYRSLYGIYSVVKIKLDPLYLRDVVRWVTEAIRTYIVVFEDIRSQNL